jgi:hypothetical protein
VRGVTSGAIGAALGAEVGYRFAMVEPVEPHSGAEAQAFPAGGGS